MLQAELDSEDGQVYGYSWDGRLAASESGLGKEKQETEVSLSIVTGMRIQVPGGPSGR